MRFYTTSQIGPKQSLTPEGFLLCEDVPIARTGEMLYGPDETPVEVDDESGIARIQREPDEVFRPETIASFNGKPIVDEHPDEDVTPDNWKDLARGIVMNPRRGKGAFDDLLLADLLVTDKEMIEDVQAGKREVSCGYDADYDQIAPGQGRQRNIIGNHVALVESGRCGSRCRIGDRSYEEKNRMSKPKLSFKDRIMRAFKAKDEGMLNEALSDLPAQDDDEEVVPASGSGEVHVHVHPHSAAPAAASEKDAAEQAPANPLEERLTKLEELVNGLAASVAKLVEGEKKEEEKEPGIHDEEEEEKEKSKAKDDEEEEEEEEEEEDGTQDEGEKVFDKELEEEASEGAKDKIHKARDSAYLEDSFQDTVALAEILAPGIRIPVFDRAMDPKKTFTSICNLRRKALQHGSTVDSKTLEIVETVLGKSITKDSFRNMTCDRVRTVFRAAGAMKRRENNLSHKAAGSHTSDTGAAGGMGVRGAIRTPADLNRSMAEFYGPQK